MADDATRIAALEIVAAQLVDKIKELDDQLTMKLAMLDRTASLVGAVTAFAGPWPPEGVDVNNIPWTEDSLGWILCDGRSLADAKYDGLRRVLKRNKAPNYQGYFLRGFNHGHDGPDTGRALGDIQGDEFKKIFTICQIRRCCTPGLISKTTMRPIVKRRCRRPRPCFWKRPSVVCLRLLSD